MLMGVEEGGGALGAVTVGGGADASSLLHPEKTITVRHE